MGQFQLGTPDTEPEVLANGGGGVGLVGALPDVQACELVLVLSDWSLLKMMTPLSKVLMHVPGFQDNGSECLHPSLW